jgi:hypothetical protein
MLDSEIGLDLETLSDSFLEEMEKIKDMIEEISYETGEDEE